MKEPCTFFPVKEVSLQSKTISPDRNPRLLHTSRKQYCYYPKSTYLKDTIYSSSHVPYGGDMEKCAFPFKDTNGGEDRGGGQE